MDMKCTICVSTLLLVACNAESPEENILVFALGAPQCESAISIESSAQKLVNAGIDVLQSMCGYVTGVLYPAACGLPSGYILIHEIRSVNLPDAEPLGFQAINTIVDAATGVDYRLVDCATGL